MSGAPLLQNEPARRHGYGAISSGSDGGGGSRDSTLQDAPALSRVLFTYVNPLMAVGNARQLNMDDLWELESENRSTTAFAQFKTQFDCHNGSILRAMLATYGLPFLFCGLGALFSAGCAVLAPAVLHHVVDAFAAPQMDVGDLTVWLGAFFASRLLNALKTLRRSVQSKSNAKAVDISNLYTSDVNNVLWAAFQINTLWILPLQIGVVIYMLYDVIGLAAFAGLGVVVATMVSSVGIASVTGVAFNVAMARKDERMKVIKEVFVAIQIVKFNAWEGPFADKIRGLRAFELEAAAKYLYFSSSSVFVLWASPIVVSTVSFAVYSIVMGQPLSAAKVFTAIALFNAIRDPLRDLPNAIQQFVQAKISLTRMSEFMNLDEYDSASVARHDPNQPEDVVLSIENGSFGWTKDTPLLKNVNLTVKKGDMVV
ncbi:Abc transporter c family member 5, partial [Globisporangium polare]